jgi:hypothetical protein
MIRATLARGRQSSLFEIEENVLAWCFKPIERNESTSWDPEQAMSSASKSLLTINHADSTSDMIRC